MAAAQQAPPSSPPLLTLHSGLVATPPPGYAHDSSQSQLGCGRPIFQAARQAFERWEQFNLGWTRIANQPLKIAPGELVAVEAHTACFWSINFNRIAEVVDNPSLFGFLYVTTALHVEEGQERFLLDFDPATESVSYLIEAVSRPRHPLARLGYPFTRAMQHRFARDSHLRMKRSVLDS